MSHSRRELEIDVLLDRWFERLRGSHLELPLPQELDSDSKIIWLYAGSSDIERNISFLKNASSGVDVEFIKWLADPTSPEAFWSRTGTTGARLPFALGVRSWGSNEGLIPENLSELLPMLKIGLVGN